MTKLPGYEAFDWSDARPISEEDRQRYLSELKNRVERDGLNCRAHYLLTGDMMVLALGNEDGSEVEYYDLVPRSNHCKKLP